MSTMNSRKTTTMVQLALITAIIILMAFTPLGYIRTPGLEITLLVVPVTAGAIIMGPMAGAVLGGVFGVTSFIQCFGWSPFGTALLGISPVGTFIVCLVPRVLMGWLAGLIFTGLKRNEKTRRISHGVASLAGPLLNSILFMGTLVLIFYNTDFIQGIATTLGTKSIFSFVIAFVGINGLIEAGVCFVLGIAVTKTVDIVYQKSMENKR